MSTIQVVVFFIAVVAATLWAEQGLERHLEELARKDRQGTSDPGE